MVSVRQRRVAIVLVQSALIAFSAALAWLLRFDFAFPRPKFFLLALLPLLSLRLLALAYFDLFRDNWRSSGIRDAAEIAKAVLLGSAAFLVVDRWAAAPSFPVSVCCIEALLTAGALAGARMSARAFFEKAQQREGRIKARPLRAADLEALLGRKQVQFNLEPARQRIAGRAVMVTGAGGSIGSELCGQLLALAPSRLVCVDRAETPLFYLQQAHTGAEVETVYRVADIADRARMGGLIREYDVRVIFHAAAYKHVPLMEENLEEAVKNNVFGLLALLEVADEAGCEDFLLVSSDKAVRPTSFMGCTKRIGELIVASRPSARMRCLSVRFGNVLGSQGSVIPLFQRQIDSRRQITVAHPEASRYCMTGAEAVALVLQAFAIGSRGDILVLDMGKPVSILGMARTLIHLSGIAQEKVKIVFGGLRPGEKLAEELFYDFEQRSATGAGKVLRAQSRVTAWPELHDRLRALEVECAAGAPAGIRAQVKQIVPQYQWVASDSTGGMPAARPGERPRSGVSAAPHGVSGRMADREKISCP
jgi:FlaA1/EpsC-like NDP-sugar epimerase